ncbi:hypothetical protein ACFL0H_04485 [Thermodesulfobacteriota bacterium]
MNFPLGTKRGVTDPVHRQYMHGFEADPGEFADIHTQLFTFHDNIPV